MEQLSDKKICNKCGQEKDRIKDFLYQLQIL